MQGKLKYLAVFTAFLWHGTAVADQNLPEVVALQAQERVDKGYHLGTVIGVIDRNGPRYYGFGQATANGADVPDAHSIFEIGSVTKVFTATLLAELDKNGELALEEQIAGYWPGIAASSPQLAAISLEHLINHTSGLPRNPTNMDAEDDHRFRKYSLDDFNAFMSSFKPEGQVGDYAYSNLGYMIVERVVEQKFGRDFEAILETRIGRPLGMGNTFFTVPDSERGKLVDGFRKGHITDELDLGLFSSFGGLRSTAHDMLQFLSAQVGLSTSPLDAAISATHDIRYQGERKTMALGWEVMERPESGKRIYYHKGGTNGFVSLAAFDPESQTGVVVLVNGRNYFSDLGFHILDASYPVTTDIPSITN